MNCKLESLNGDMHDRSDTIDQLVCGSLRGKSYREALQWLESDPGKWRACALAFLQEQAIEQEIQQLAEESIDWHGEHGSRVVGCSSSPHPKPNFGDVTNRAVVVPASSTTAFYSRHIFRLASVAALIVLSFTAGWYGGLPDRQGLQGGAGSGGSTYIDSSGLAGNERKRAGDAASNYAAYSDAREYPKPGDFGPSWVFSDESLRNNPTLVGNISDSLLPIDQEIPQALRDLERMGRIRVESSSALMPIHHENGASVLVPVQQLQIVPVVYSY